MKDVKDILFNTIYDNKINFKEVNKELMNMLEVTYRIGQLKGLSSKDLVDLKNDVYNINNSEITKKLNDKILSFQIKEILSLQDIGLNDLKCKVHDSNNPKLSKMLQDKLTILMKINIKH